MQRKSALACFKTIDLILELKHGKGTAEEIVPRLRTALRNHMRCHIEAYGVDGIKPKHHWLFDCVEQFLLDGFVMDAFIIERLHLRAKAAEDRIKNLSQFERSALASILNMHEANISSSKLDNGLLAPIRALPGAPSVTIADSLEYESVLFKIGDRVIKQPEGYAAEILACLAEGTLYVIVLPLELVRQVSPSSACWRVRQDVRLLAEAAHLRPCLAWYWTAEGVTVLCY